jgi:DNA-binding transcriptional MerR regulator
MNSYRIGEFARKVGVSPDFLKYQEEFGIVDPQQSESNYRYYRFSQAGRVYASLFYRNLGFPLRDISTLLNGESSAQIMRRINGRAADIEREICRLQACQQTIEELNAAVCRMALPNPWYIDDLPGFAFLPHAHNNEFIEDERIPPILAEWMMWFPSVFPCQRIPPSALADTQGAEDGGHCWGLMVDTAFSARHGMPLDEPVWNVPPGRYLIYYQELDMRDENEGPTAKLDVVLKQLRDVVNNHALSVAGDIYHRMLFHSHDGGRHYLNSMFYLPLA